MRKMLIVFFCILLLHVWSAQAQPEGVNINVGQSTSKDLADATNFSASGGNVTYIEADISQNSNVWQGFYGTVTGGVLLGNADGDIFYDWNVVDAVGEIIAARETITDWTNINCSNQTQIYREEESLGITNSTSDGINDTYANTTHPDFTVAGRVMSGCRSTQTYNSTSEGVFWNAILNTDSDTAVYAGIMQNDIAGFNGTATDFQLLVPTNVTSGIATYFLYIELGAN